jgi:hypothetical protein
MSPTAQTLFQSALSLPSADRVALGEALISTDSELPVNSATGAAYLEELRARSADTDPNSWIPETRPMTGAEIVAYLQAEGLIGYRTDITDSQAHARMLRERLESTGFAKGLVTYMADDFNAPMELVDSAEYARLKLLEKAAVTNH